MDEAVFGYITNRIIELTGNKSAFKGLQLVSYDEKAHHAVIQASDFVNMSCIKTRFSHEVVEAFDSILGVETTVSCVYNKNKHMQPHERFIMQGVSL